MQLVATSIFHRVFVKNESRNTLRNYAQIFMVKMCWRSNCLKVAMSLRLPLVPTCFVLIRRAAFPVAVDMTGPFFLKRSHHRKTHD